MIPVLDIGKMEGAEMKVLFVLLMLVGVPATFGQTRQPQDCKRALTDPHFRIPAQISVGQGPAWGARTVVPLFSENGMNFYGLDRMKSQTGEPIRENSVWIVGVFSDENLRQTEAQLLMQRLNNPHLDADYASSLKFVVVDMELADDRESAKYKAWMKCSSLTSSQSKCQYPPQVPTVWDVSYFQPQECVITTAARGLLFDDSVFGIAYTNHQYKAPPSLMFQQSLMKAAYIMLAKFKTEDEMKDKQDMLPLSEPTDTCWTCVFPSWKTETSSACQNDIAKWKPTPQTLFHSTTPSLPSKFKEISFLFSKNGMDFYGAFPLYRDAFSGTIYTVIISLSNENVRRAWAELTLSKNEDQTLLREDISHLKYVVVDLRDLSSGSNYPKGTFSIVGRESFYEPESCVLPGQKDRENAQMTNLNGPFYHHGNWLGDFTCSWYKFSPFHCANYGGEKTPDPLLIQAVKMMQEKNDHAQKPEQKQIQSHK